jgi:hypothetical protein
MTTLLDAVHRLDLALVALADALGRADAAAVLASEAALAEALSIVTSADRAAIDRHALSHAIDAVHLSLARCRALGQSAEDMANIVLPPATYTRSGS